MFTLSSRQKKSEKKEEVKAELFEKGGGFVCVEELNKD